MFIERPLSKKIMRASRTFPVVMLTGARQVGKTTLLRHLDPKREFVTLDDMEARRQAKEDPKLFLERFPPPVFIDEFQYAPEILPYIKIRVDERRTLLKRADGAFWLSGSQNFALMKGVQESLAGRVAVIQLFGLSLAETAGARRNPSRKTVFEAADLRFETSRKISELFEIILRGDKPELWVKRDMTPAWYYSSYVQTYLERDVRSQLGVRQLGLFDKFLRLLAGRVGQLLNMASLANEIGITIPTVKQWMTVLERSGQILLLQPYFGNLNKRLVKTPKVYFMDTGLAAHLLKWTEPSTTLAGPMAGALFENWVVSEIAKSYYNRGEDPGLYFWRTRDGEEFDLVRESGGRLQVAEIKLGSMVQPMIVQRLRKLKALGGRVGGFRIICSADRNMKFEGAEIVSAWSL